ncbi:hypothetical protein CFIO01_03046 [Colletotrichum fioriniae PJ7]|uniref:Uncharacterized protein n=1 Tax=Colletotrichum fioriniae PJ7 TaxID=1445577 RepID=A0A010QLY7_9PEZI|nr:hypothetical protein CFIO01_03046 [Colletotrichum fioriniae PJ7]
MLLHLVLAHIVLLVCIYTVLAYQVKESIVSRKATQVRTGENKKANIEPLKPGTYITSTLTTLNASDTPPPSLANLSLVITEARAHNHHHLSDDISLASLTKAQDRITTYLSASLFPDPKRLALPPRRKR